MYVLDSTDCFRVDVALFESRHLSKMFDNDTSFKPSVEAFASAFGKTSAMVLGALYRVRVPACFLFHLLCS